MIHTQSPVSYDKKVMFVPLADLGKAKPFLGESLNVYGFPRYKLVDSGTMHYIALPWDWETLRKLAVHDIFVPGPIRWEYDWPTKYDHPLPHQVVTADFFTQNPRAFCFNDIGTSKTLSALWAADYLLKLGQIRRVLIVSTVSTLHRTWYNEIFSNIRNRTFNVVDGSAKRRRERLAEDVDFHIINHDGVKGLEDELMKSDHDLVIVDEGAVYRNQKTGLWRSIYNIAGIHSDRWLWWMTGGPMPKAPTDVWAQAKVVRPDTVPRYFKQFRNMTMVEVANFKWVPIKGAEDIVFNTLRPVIRYDRDVCELPPDHTQDIRVEMSALQQRAYDLMEKDAQMMLQDEAVTAANDGVVRNKLLQIAAGAIYTNEGNVVSLDPEAKFKELDDLLDFSNHKLIVYAPFKYCLPMIAQRYRDQGVSVETISGDTPPPKRNEVFQQFQDGDLQMIVAHPKCMAHGLTLTRSNVITWWAPVDDNDIYNQACGRIKRPGQRKEQYVIHLTSSDVETEIYRRLQAKEAIQGKVLTLFKKQVDASPNNA